MAAPNDTNPSFVLKKPLEVAFENREIPTLPSDRHVLLRLATTGICGSDVHYWQHGRIGSFILHSPMVLGHESSATVLSVGPAVTTVAPGDRVALEPGVPCRFCGPCKAGKYNLCTDMRFAATPPYDGTLCKYYTLPEDFCHKLPENVGFEEGALMEPLAVAVHVSRLAGIQPGENVVIFGAGPIGVLCAAVARAYGADKVVVADVNPERLKFAEEFAATGTLDVRGVQDVAEELKKRFGLSGGADNVIEATGAEPCIKAACGVVRAGGVVVQAGMGKPEVSMPLVELAAKEAVLKGSFRYSAGDYELALKLVGEGKVDVKRLVTRRFEFEEALEAFETVKRGEGIKVLINAPKDNWKLGRA